MADHQGPCLACGHTGKVITGIPGRAMGGTWIEGVQQVGVPLMMARPRPGDGPPAK